MKPAAERIERGLWWDRPWKLIEGCSPVSEGCLNCWSAREAHMRAKQKNEKIRAQYEGLTTPEGRWNGRIRLMEKNLDLPLRVKKPQVWAVWNDLFHEDVPTDFIVKAFDVMSQAPQHTFIILTKRVDSMGDFICGMALTRLQRKPLENLWLGVTAENQQQADERIPVLLQIPAAVRFVSVEPMLGPVSFRWRLWEPFKNEPGAVNNHLDALRRLDWIICGAESGSNRRHIEIDCIRNLRDQCVDAGVPFFLKQMDVNGQLVKMPELDGQVWEQWPEVSQ